MKPAIAPPPKPTFGFHLLAFGIVVFGAVSAYSALTGHGNEADVPATAPAVAQPTEDAPQAAPVPLPAPQSHPPSPVVVAAPLQADALPGLLPPPDVDTPVTDLEAIAAIEPPLPSPADALPDTDVAGESPEPLALDALSDAGEVVMPTPAPQDAPAVEAVPEPVPALAPRQEEQFTAKAAAVAGPAVKRPPTPEPAVAPAPKSAPKAAPKPETKATPSKPKAALKPEVAEEPADDGLARAKALVEAAKREIAERNAKAARGAAEPKASAAPPAATPTPAPAPAPAAVGSGQTPAPVPRNGSRSVTAAPLVPSAPKVLEVKGDRAWVQVDQLRTVIVRKGQSVPGLGVFLGEAANGARFESGVVPVSR